MSTPPWQSNLLALCCGFRQQLSSVLVDVLLLPQQACGLQPWYVPCLRHDACDMGCHQVWLMPSCCKSHPLCHLH